MANIRRKRAYIWDDGIKTSTRSNNPETIEGAQLVKGFDVYKDPKKLIPMQSWESFTTEEEKQLGIRAMGGVSETIYGVGKAMKNWYAKEWPYRIKVTASQQLFLGASAPLHVDLSQMPSDFWDNVKEDLSDVRITTLTGAISSGYVENVDYAGQTGDLWVQSNTITRTQTVTNSIEFTPNNNTVASIENSGVYAIFIPVILDGNTINHFRIKNIHKVLTDSTSMGTMTVSLYSNNAGVPNALVQTLGTYDTEYLPQHTTGDYRDFVFTPFTYSGTYHIVITCSGASVSNIFRVNYQSTGTQTVGVATNAGLTTWSALDTSATIGYSFGYLPTDDISFYVYYGNSTASTLPEATDGFDYQDARNEVFRQNNLRFAYSFGSSGYGNLYQAGSEGFETAPDLYVDGLVGKAIKKFSGTMQTDDDDDVALTGNDIGVSLMIKNYTGTLSNILYAANNGWSLSVSAGNLSFTVDGNVSNPTHSSGITMLADKWYLIDITLDNYISVGVNGTFSTDTSAAGDYDGVSPDDRVSINAGGTGAIIGHIWGFNNNTISESSSKTKLYNFTESSFWTIGSQEAQTNVNIQYEGVQLYQKNIESGDWQSVLNQGRPIKNFEYNPINAFIDDTASYFMLSSQEENSGSWSLGKVDNLSLLDPNYLLLGVLTESPRIIPQPETAINNTLYFNGNGSNLCTFTDENVFAAGSSIESLVSWRTYLALAYTYRNKGYVNIWDLVADSQATERISVGTGRCRIVGDASDTLFAVVDNYVDSAVRSASKPTVEIRQYVGNGRMETTHVLEIPVNIPTSSYADYWDLAVTNFKIFRNQQTLFYARLPKDSTGTTFNEGFWAVGKNSKGELSLTLQIDTGGLGMPENVFAFAQQVFFIAKDGGIFRLSDNTYDNVALFTTQKMNEGDTDVEKKLIGVEVVTEPLEADQTISVYYRINGSTDRTKIFDMTLDNSFNGNGLSYETTYDINEDNLPHYQEIEFDIESTGGKSAVLELNYKYEYLSNVV